MKSLKEWDREILEKKELLVGLNNDLIEVCTAQSDLAKEIENISLQQSELDTALQKLEDAAKEMAQSLPVRLRCRR